MSKKAFNEEEIKILSNNKYVERASSKSITYTDELKNIILADLELGKTSREIFIECGFDISIIGMKRIHLACNRWKTAYAKNGILGLTDTRKYNSGREPTKHLSTEELLKRAELKIEMLEMENEILKKIEKLER